MTKRTIPEDKQRRATMMEIVREMGITDANELYIALRDMFAETMEDMLKAELDEHLGYEKHDQREKETSKRRNGSAQKLVRSHAGEMEIGVPRDREGSFEPQVVKKGEKDVSQIQEKILSMSGKRLTSLPVPPLRTVRESFPSYGSSLSQGPA